MKNKKAVTVSKEVWEELFRRRIDLGYKTLNDVIKKLLDESDD